MGDIYSYAGTNIIDYKIKSVHGPYKVKARMIRKRYDDEDDAEFQEEKERNKRVADNLSAEHNIEFVVVENSDDCYILESTEEILDEYRIALDVQYSTFLGVSKRNVLNITVCQSIIDSKDYKITGLLGIIL